MGVNMSKVLFSVGAGGAATFLIYSLWKTDKPLGFTPRSPVLGLRNRGNTCFLNAILQAFASCRFMLGWLRIKDEECNNNITFPVTAIHSFHGLSYPLIAAMYRAILIINRDMDVDDNIFSRKVPGDVLTGLRYHGHKIGVQQEQDAFEVFQLIATVLNFEVEQSIRRKQVGSMGTLSGDQLDNIVEEAFMLPLEENNEPSAPGVDMGMGCGDWALVGDTGYRVSDGIYSKRRLQMKWDYKASPKSPFHCLMFAQMQCIVCLTKTKVRLEASDSLTLPLPPSELCAGISINDLLINYMRPGLVHNVDCDTCTAKALEALGGCNESLHGTHSKIKSTFFKYSYIAKLPNVLCIHIPRCLWGTDGLTKRTEYVRFPERLNLSDLKRLYDAKTAGNEREESENENDFEEKSDNEGGLRRFRNSEYHLVAVVSHVGVGVDGGHFVTFRRKSPIQKKSGSFAWYYVSDEMVQPIPYSCVMGTKAYMLFYEKTHISP